MSKQVYISADYSEEDGDRNVVNELHRWSNDNRYAVDYVDTAQVAKGSVADDPDCRFCDLKKEFNGQINASSAVIFIIGDKTKDRTAGSSCDRLRTDRLFCSCTPYKQNANGSTLCKIAGNIRTTGLDDIGEINSFSFLEHEFRQAIFKKKNIVIVYNSMNKQPSWLPSYMSNYEYLAHPFWKYNATGKRVGDYTYIKSALGY